MGEGELDRMCDEANRDWRRACVVADAVMLPTGVRSVAFTHQDSNSAPAHSDPDTHTPGAWPEPYDPAGDSDTDTGSLNTGLDRLGDHGACSGGFGRVDRAQSMDRARRDVPPDGREPVRDPRREAAVTTVSVDRDEIKEIGLAADAMTREAQERGEYEWLERQPGEYACPDPLSHGSVPMSSIQGLIEQIRHERDEWKARAESAERKLTNRAQCCVENEDRLRPRDARVEPPPGVPDHWVLIYLDGLWQPSFWTRVGPAGWSYGVDTLPVDVAPYWLPMPPTPQEQK